MSRLKNCSIQNPKFNYEINSFIKALLSCQLKYITERSIFDFRCSFCSIFAIRKKYGIEKLRGLLLIFFPSICMSELLVFWYQHNLSKTKKKYN